MWPAAWVLLDLAIMSVISHHAEAGDPGRRVVLQKRTGGPQIVIMPSPSAPLKGKLREASPGRPPGDSFTPFRTGSTLRLRVTGHVFCNLASSTGRKGHFT